MKFKLFQDEENAPIQTTLRSSGPHVITWSRIGVGEFVGSVAPPLPAGTFVQWTNADVYLEKAVDVLIQDPSTLYVRTMENGVLTDGILEELQVVFELDIP